MNMKKEYIIRVEDYIQHLEDEVMLYTMLSRCNALIKELPKGKDSGALKHHAKHFSARCDAMLQRWSIQKCLLADEDVDDFAELLEQELISPEDAGYISFEELERYANEGATGTSDSDDDDEDATVYQLVDALISISQCLTDCAKHILGVVSEGLDTDE